MLFTARRSVCNQIKLHYFEDVLPVEFKAINDRRSVTNGQRPASRQRHPVNRLQPNNPPAKSGLSQTPSPDADKLFPRPLDQARCEGPPSEGQPVDPLDQDKTRPRPVPCDATGLAFSGGGIRSAAICLGALQALNRHRCIEEIDYLSTVSGGGY